MCMDNLKRFIEQLNKMAQEYEQASREIEQNNPLADNFIDFENFFEGELNVNNSVHELLYDISEENGNVVVVLDLPGFTEDQISIQADERQIRINAEATDDMRRESVSHTFSLPSEVVPSESKATFENGVLEVTLPLVDDDNDDSTKIDIS